MEHTPIPWRIDERSSTHVVGANSRHIASTGGYATNTDNGEHHDENDANAAFIVQAVNSHQALVEALNEALSELETIDGNLEDGRETYVDGIRLELVRAALKQARGER